MKRKPILANPDYEVTELGEVYRIDTGKKMTVSKKNSNSNSYGLTLRKNTKKQNLKIENVVAEAFISNPNNYEFVGFKDNDRSNYQASNLYWKETRHYTGNQTSINNNRSNKTNEDVENVLEYLKETTLSYAEIGSRLNLHKDFCYRVNKRYEVR